MAGGLRSYSFRRVYEASSCDLVDDFYIPAMMRATQYDRAVGYFRSSIFHLVQIAISDFILRGGRMRLVCSTSFDHTDESVIRESHSSAGEADNEITEGIKASLRDLASLPIIELLATIVLSRLAHESWHHTRFHMLVSGWIVEYVIRC